ncbi:hypothetical protein ML462_09765 [Gramella lutea]|uniref:Uncharacterized protein n=1 Tax=Christiangramia lutea TaxID=1607951 RepID=A0A9X1V3H3_9FLAO|nr:hypothetical protein [Christiangramia lutea]MCH4823459.1 hypothetical protein [Christiangramia lutea]
MAKIVFKIISKMVIDQKEYMDASHQKFGLSRIDIQRMVRSKKILGYPGIFF